MDENTAFPACSISKFITANLDSQFRMPIYLHYYAGYSYKDIAGILKISESAVAVRINRGKAMMRIGLEEYL